MEKKENKIIFPPGTLFEVLQPSLRKCFGPVAMVIKRTFAGKVDNYKVIFSSGDVLDAAWLELEGLYKRIS